MTPWPPELVDALSLYFFILKIITPSVVIVIFISSIDDALIDAIYLTRRVIRAIFIYRKHPRWDVTNTKPVSEQPLALMIAAWDEGEVIDHMLRHLINTYAYKNYRIYVGVYPNDPATYSAVARVKRESEAHGARLEIVVNSRPGPTSKADCLNSIYAHIITHGRGEQLFVVHDAEDMVDPYEAWVFNHLIPKKAMVQIPVQPLLRPGCDFIGGHYADEFAENHRKELVTREAISGGIPSAGVGCAYSLDALQHAARLRDSQPFNTNSLTEDYDLALTIRQAGMKTVFVRMNHGNCVDKASTVLATRAYFPNSFKTAIRQKTRWLIGITLQSWEEFGWRGTLWQRYMFFRDRKVLITAPFTIIAFILMMNAIIIHGAPHIIPNFPQFSGLIDTGSFIAHLVILNMFFMGNRIVQRVWHVSRLYGLIQGFLSVPRIAVCALINCAATFRALLIFDRAKRHGSALAWDKTQHVFPNLSPQSGSAPQRP